MVRGGRSQRVSTSVGQGDCLPVHAGHPDDRDCLPVHAGRPSDWDRLPDHASSATFPFFLTTRWRASIQQWMRRDLSYLDDNHVRFQGEDRSWFCSRYITTLVHTHIPGPVDAWREFPVPVWDLLFDMFTWRYAFTRPEDLPRARAVWDSTAQTNLIKSMYEARDKAMKTTGSRDPMAWLDYGPVWLRRDYWEIGSPFVIVGLLDHGRSGHRRQNATDQLIRRRMCILCHELERAPTFRELFDRTHKRKGTDDYVSESTRMIAETYDRTMADRYVEEMRTLIREELRMHFGIMVEQLISTMQGVRPSQPAPQFE
ncbi:hypothetical protein Taro_045163 [Colocasia esculenta]|uniref:Uncharacterized protein n=1 Tax=Colocasia esculenta TaxID=4460 RepID=A0A843WZP2_COLES|nr:hypothetical protein [Colocasia esculenta]